MMNRAMSMTAADSRPACAAQTMSCFAFMNAVCYFCALRFYFYYYFTRSCPSERKQIS